MSMTICPIAVHGGQAHAKAGNMTEMLAQAHHNLLCICLTGVFRQVRPVLAMNTSE
jgi:hypothetical protein